jgi:hypothetical protein
VSRLAGVSWFPAFDFQDATEADGVITTPAFAIFSDAKEFYLHFRRFGGVTIAKLDEMILPTFQSAAPIWRLLTILDAFLSRRDRREPLLVQVQMQDGWCIHNSRVEVAGQWASVLSVVVLEV